MLLKQYFYKQTKKGKLSKSNESLQTLTYISESIVLDGYENRTI